jgi:formylglycine-generating enzyme required for sulfatase activity
MDQFEASVGSSCPHKETESELATIDNVSNEHCVPVSAVDALPWRFVSFTQAQQLCARAGKRLPTATEWYRAAAGLMVDDHCVLTTAAVEKSTSGRCASPAGVSDLVGNVWEWVDETVTEGKWNDRYLPASGYVDSVDEAGMVLTTSATANRAYGSDYAWINQTATRGIVRGGFYGSRDDGGIFAQNLTLTTDFTAAGVGFRCVQDVH